MKNKVVYWSCVISQLSRWDVIDNLEVLDNTFGNLRDRPTVLLTRLQDRRNGSIKEMVEAAIKMRFLKQVYLNNCV